MIRYISQDEITSFLAIPEDKTEYVFNQVVLLRGCVDDPPRIKLSDLFDIQFYFLCSPQAVKEVRQIEKQASIESAAAVQTILDDKLDLWKIMDGNWHCPSCGSNKFNRHCVYCLKRYNLPENAVRIEITANDIYPALSLGYMVELMPIPESGAEFRLAKVKIDGNKNTGFVYFRNVRIIEE